MLLILILSCVCLTGIHAQTFLPSQCAHLYGGGSANPYNATSIAAIYQRFCSVRQSISQCIETNKAYMLASNNAVDWALALTFDKNHFDSKAQLLCQKLPEVSTELECLTSHQNDLCVQILSASIPSVYRLYTSGNITNTLAKVTLCGLLTNTGDCYKRDLTTCSTRAKSFVSDYYEMFSGDCMGSVSDMLPPSLKTSAFVSCAMESFNDTINGIMQQISKQAQNTTSIDYIMEFVFSAAKEMCKKTGVFSNCVVERVKTSTNEIDQMILQFINVNKIKESLDLQCSHMDDFTDLFKNSPSCVKAMTQQTTYCGSIYMGNLFPQTSGGMMTTTVAPLNINSYVNMICPGLKGMVDCMYLPLSRCKKGMDLMMDNMVTMLMSDRCKALADQGQPSINLNPQASVFLQCGMTMSSLFVEEGVIPTRSPLSANQGPQSQGIQYGDMPTVIRKGMDVVCRNANWYISCIDQRLPHSNNIIDKFFKEIIDFSDNVNRTKIISEVCGRHLTDIKNSVDCFMSKFPQNTNNQPDTQNNQLIQCISQTNLSIWSVFGDPQRMYNMNGQSIRSTFCTPLDGMIKCARSSLGTCSRTVGSLMNSLPKDILRTDCGGVRTTPRPNTEKNNDPSSASDYKANTVWTTSVILITALLTTWY